MRFGPEQVIGMLREKLFRIHVKSLSGMPPSQSA